MAGAIGPVSFNKEGLADTYFNVQHFDATLNRIFRIIDSPDKYLSFIQVLNVRNTSELETNGMAIHYIAYSKDINIGFYVSAKRIGKEGNPYGIQIFKTGTSIYYKTTKLGGHLFFIGSNIKVVEVNSIPEGAEEVTVY